MAIYPAAAAYPGSVSFPGLWLLRTLNATTAPTTVSETYDPQGLAPGTYTASYAVSSGASGVTNSPQTRTVTLVVTAAATPTPTIALDSAYNAFAVTIGNADPAAQVVNITNSGDGSLSVLSRSISYGSGAGWLTATLGATTEPTTLTLSCARGALAAGNYTATVNVASSAAGVTNSPQVISVVFSVSDPGTGSVVFGVDRRRRALAALDYINA